MRPWFSAAAILLLGLDQVGRRDDLRQIKLHRPGTWQHAREDQFGHAAVDRAAVHTLGEAIGELAYMGAEHAAQGHRGALVEGRLPHAGEVLVAGCRFLVGCVAPSGVRSHSARHNHLKGARQGNDNSLAVAAPGGGGGANPEDR